MFALIITDSSGETHIHSLTEGHGHYYTLGRSEECDISLPHEGHISRVHCLLRIDGHRVYLQDNNSVNGIYVGIRKITGEYMATERDYTIGCCTMVLIRTQDEPHDEQQLPASDDSEEADIPYPVPTEVDRLIAAIGSGEDAATQAFTRPPFKEDENR
ncbi:MAG: FHA domain-containing protein [Akkermansia sp.]|nr:FHA domain-containing protein [Akkermansia sp.]